MGLRDQTRGTLFFDIMEIVRAKRPRFLILENVPNLVGPNHRSTWPLMIATIREAGYRVSSTPVVISPTASQPASGAPQVRDRVFILAHHDPDRASSEMAPLASESVAARGSVGRGRSMGSIENGEPAEAYKIRPVERTWLNAWDAFVRGIPVDDLPGFPIWAGRLDGPQPASRSECPTGNSLSRENSAFYGANRDFVDEWLDAHSGRPTWPDSPRTSRPRAGSSSGRPEPSTRPGRAGPSGISHPTAAVRDPRQAGRLLPCAGRDHPDFDRR